MGRGLGAARAPHADAGARADASRVPRGVIVCGPARDPAARAGGARWRPRPGWPVLAEPTSGLRCGAHDRSHVVAHYDVLLRAERFADEHRPELVLRVGDTPTSKPLRAWLAEPRAGRARPARDLARADAQRASGSRRADPGAHLRRARGDDARRRRTPTGSRAGARPTRWSPPALAEAADPFEPKA